MQIRKNKSATTADLPTARHQTHTHTKQLSGSGVLQSCGELSLSNRAPELFLWHAPQAEEGSACGRSFRCTYDQGGNQNGHLQERGFPSYFRKMCKIDMKNSQIQARGSYGVLDKIYSKATMNKNIFLDGFIFVQTWILSMVKVKQ